MSQFTHHMMMIKSKNCEMKMGKKIDKTKQIKQTSDMSSSENKSGFFMTDFFFWHIVDWLYLSYDIQIHFFFFSLDDDDYDYRWFVCLFVCTSLSLHIYK